MRFSYYLGDSFSDVIVSEVCIHNITVDFKNWFLEISPEMNNLMLVSIIVQKAVSILISFFCLCTHANFHL